MTHEFTEKMGDDHPATPPIELSIVIPCYRSGEWLEECVDRIVAAIATHPSVSSVELILVNDASPDDTWKTIASLAERSYPNSVRFRGINLQFNCGQFRATLCGLSLSSGAVVVTMDDDLQHPPEALPDLLQPLLEDDELDGVLARFPQKQHSAIRNLGSYWFRALNQYLYGAPKELVLSSFRALRRSTVDAICAHRTANPIMGPLLLMSSRKLENVDVEHAERTHGKSGYGIWRLCRIALANFFSSSTLPLRIVSYLGVLSSSMSGFLAAGYFARYLLFGRGVKGFTTQVLLMNFYGGLTLFAIGLLGEYLIRVVDEVRRPPRFHVRDEV